MDSYFHLQDKLLAQCVHFPPQPLPRSVKDGSAGLCQLVCGNNHDLAVAFHKKLESLLPRNIDEGEDITFFAKLDPQKKCLDVYHAQKASRELRELRNVDVFFEKQVNSEAGAGKAEIRKFLAANKMDTDDMHLAQEHYSIAFAMQVLLRNLPSLKVSVKGESVPVSSVASVEKIVARLFDTETEKKKASKLKKKKIPPQPADPPHKLTKKRKKKAKA